MIRLLITGSRDWPDPGRVEATLDGYCRWADLMHEGHPYVDPAALTVVHGACPTGADEFADQWARKVGATIERHPADWHALGKKAGPIRNRTMVDLGADQCIAFLGPGSKGGAMTADWAMRAGIPTRIMRPR